MNEIGVGDNWEDDIIIDLEHMFDTILPDDEDDLLFLHHDDANSNTSPCPPSSLVVPDPSPCAPVGSSLSMIEEFLLNDDHCHSVDHLNHPQLLSAADDFLSDILLDSPLSLQDSSSPSFPEIDQQQEEQEVNIRHQQLPPPPQLHEDDKEEEDKENLPPNDIIHNEDADLDPLVKKRKRQLRNRDAAVRSRERKKMYVKDLEMKSKYYEAECRRLGMLLNCYLAENHSLRLSLHNTNKAFDTSATKQESAVLFLESLLLGSLLWFLGIIGLLILPIQLLSILGATGVGNVGSKNQGNLVPREAESNVFKTLEGLTFMMSKRCRGSRRKMRGVLPKWDCKSLNMFSLSFHL